MKRFLRYLRIAVVILLLAILNSVLIYRLSPTLGWDALKGPQGDRMKALIICLLLAIEFGFWRWIVDLYNRMKP